jgi:hypothetical protein
MRRLALPAGAWPRPGGGYGLLFGGAISALPMTATSTAPAAMTIVAITVCLLLSLENEPGSAAACPGSIVQNETTAARRRRL